MSPIRLKPVGPLRTVGVNRVGPKSAPIAHLDLGEELLKRFLFESVEPERVKGDFQAYLFVFLERDDVAILGDWLGRAAAGKRGGMGRLGERISVGKRDTRCDKGPENNPIRGLPTFKKFPYLRDEYLTSGNFSFRYFFR